MHSCTNIVLAALATILIIAGSCKKDKEEVFPQFPPPSWENEATGHYAHSMTAVVKLPPDLQAAYRETDELAAFIGEECRAVARPVNVSGTSLFYLLIQGDAAEPGKITFRYYSSATSYIYIADNTPGFSPDGTYGTADQPRVLTMQPRK